MVTTNPNTLKAQLRRSSGDGVASSPSLTGSSSELSGQLEAIEELLMEQRNWLKPILDAVERIEKELDARSL